MRLRELMAPALAASIIFGQAPDLPNATARGQDDPADARLTFDVASVRVHLTSQAGGPPAGTRGGPGTNDPAQITYGNVPLYSLLMGAFQVKFNRLGPDSIKQPGERYDVVAKIPPGTTKQQMSLMLQNLLKERFHMMAHREIKEEQIYELVVGKNGIKLAEAAPADGSPDPFRFGTDKDGFPQVPPGRPMIARFVLRGGETRLTARMQLIADLPAQLEGVVDRPIIDKTGLAGEFDFKLAFSSERVTASPTSGTLPPDPAPTVFDALQAQLGLKLQPAKGMVERVVVDHIDKVPTDN